MKNSYLLISLIMYASFIYAQNPVPNPSFELWDGNNFTGWESSTSIEVFGGNSQLAVPTGTKSASMTYSGNLSVGNGSGINTTTRWTYLNFRYYFDFNYEAEVWVYLKNGNDTIGIAYKNLTSTLNDTIFSDVSLPITYTQPGNPTNCTINFTLDDHGAGGSLYIDDVSLDTAAVLTGLTPTTPGKNSRITLSPNPVTDYVNVKLNDESNYANTLLGIYNITGNLLWEQPLRSGLAKIGLDWLPEGIYLLRLNSGNLQTASRFVKAK